MGAFDTLTHSVFLGTNQSGEPYSWCNKGDGMHQCLIENHLIQGWGNADDVDQRPGSYTGTLTLSIAADP